MENELKELLRQRADDFDMAPDPPRGLVRRIHRRRMVNVTLAGAVAVALVAGASIGIREAVLAVRRVDPAESPSPTATPSPEPTTEPGPAASPRAGTPPATFVAFQSLDGGDPLGRLVVVDTSEGRVLRVLLDQVDTSEGGIYAPDLSADGGTLYYTMGTSACTDDVLRLRLDGGEEEVLATQTARRATVSPDGRLLAYLRGDPCIGEEQHIVVRDLVGREEIRWRHLIDRSSGAEPVSVRRLAWMSDSRTLAYELGDLEASSIFLLDTEGERGIELGTERRLGPQDSSLELVGLHAEGVAAVRKCLSPSEPGCPPRPEIVAVDPETGEIVTTLLRPAPEAFAFDLDSSGRHLLYIGQDGLYRWSGGEPVKIGNGYFAAAW